MQLLLGPCRRHLVLLVARPASRSSGSSILEDLGELELAQRRATIARWLPRLVSQRANFRTVVRGDRFVGWETTELLLSSEEVRPFTTKKTLKRRTSDLIMDPIKGNQRKSRTGFSIWNGRAATARWYDLVGKLTRADSRSSRYRPRRRSHPRQRYRPRLHGRTDRIRPRSARWRRARL